MRNHTSRSYACVLSTHTAGLGIIRSLGEAGIPVIAAYYEEKDMGFVSKYVHYKFKCPNPEYNEKGFISSLISIGQQFPGSVLFPGDDETLSAVSKNIGLLSNIFSTRALGLEAAETILNKQLTYIKAQEAGVEIPQTYMVNSIKEAEYWAEKLEFPLLIKPAYSHSFFRKFKVKMFTARSMKDINKYLKLAEEAKQAVMLQEYIPGEDTFGYNYNSIRLPEMEIVDFTAQKIRMSNNGKGVPVVVKSINPIEEITVNAKKLLNSLNYYGYSCIEFKKDSRNGKFKLMEINGRFNRSILLSYKCGINFPEIAFNYAVNKKTGAKDNYKPGVFWIDEFRDLQIILQKIRNKESKLKELLIPYRSERIKAVWNVKDPFPLIRRSYDIGRTVLRSLSPQKKLVTIREEESPPANRHFKKVKISVK